MTCAIRSRSTPCSMPTAAEAMSACGSRCCPPIWDTPSRATPTGTCTPPPRCLARRPGADGPGRRQVEHPRRAGLAMTVLAPTLQAFFTDRLTQQLGASAHTIAAYRDTWRLLLPFAAARTGHAPTRLDISDFDAGVVGEFLNHLENERGNSIRTRNGRLAAIHSTFTFAALRHPEHAETIARVLAIPPKRYDRPQV